LFSPPESTMPVMCKITVFTAGCQLRTWIG
jgi:hypothetical protein